MSVRATPVALLVALVTIAAAPCIGITGVGWPHDEVSAIIFWQIRVPRVILAALAGAVLAGAGLVFQSVFRNTLATPYTLGVSSGAALGAALYFQTGVLFSLAGLPGASLAALGGALATVMLVVVFARRSNPVGLLLAGVVLSFLFSSVIVFVQYVSDFNAVFHITRWLMGGFEGARLESLPALAVLCVLGLTFLYRRARELDLLALGEEVAAGRGLDVSRVRTGLLSVSALLVGVIVALSGPIGFVGIMIPHVAARLVGFGHARTFPLTLVLGAAFLTACDTVGRVLVAPWEIPVGVITALLGGPYFLWFLLRQRGERSR